MPVTVYFTNGSAQRVLNGQDSQWEYSVVRKPAGGTNQGPTVLAIKDKQDNTIAQFRADEIVGYQIDVSEAH